MRRRWLQLAMVLLTGFLPARAQVIDRIVATVNGQPVLQSEWDIALRCQALFDQRPLRYTDDEARAELDRLIDQELLRQQIRSYHLRPVTPQEVSRRLEEIRRQIPGAESDAGWQSALDRYGLTDAEVRERIAGQIEILRFLDVRLRPTVRIDRASVTAYYRDKLLPELQKKGAAPVPLAEVTPQIEEILSQQRLDSLLTELLQDLRQHSEIRVQPAAAPSAGNGAVNQEAR